MRGSAGLLLLLTAAVATDFKSVDAVVSEEQHASGIVGKRQENELELPSTGKSEQGAAFFAGTRPFPT